MIGNELENKINHIKYIKNSILHDKNKQQRNFFKNY